MSEPNYTGTEYTETQLLRAISKMLPFGHTLEERDRYCTVSKKHYPDFYYHMSLMSWPPYKITDNEPLQLCWFIEESLTEPELHVFGTHLHKEAVDKKYMHSCYYAIHAKWESRVVALAKVKGIEIV